MPVTRMNDAIVLKALEARGEQDPGLATKCRMLAEQRARSAEDAERTDRLLVTRLVGLRSSLEEARAARAELARILEQLRELVTTLTAPPYASAIFCGVREIAGHSLAEVVHGQERRLVGAGPAVRLEELSVGDPVYLTHGGNVLFSRGDPERGGGGELAVVERLTSGGRLVLRHHGEEVVVGRAGRLSDAGIRSGDQVVWHPSSRLALELLPPAESQRWLLREVDAAPDALAGLDRDRDRLLRRFVLHVLHPDIAARYGLNGNISLLLYGPPGCGKTTLMRILAAELTRLAGQRCRVAVVNGAELESPWVGETQRNVRNLFRELASSDGPRMLFIDEADAIGRQRGGPASHISDKFLSTWLTELDGIRGLENVAVVAATNRRDLMDPALLERLSGLELHVPRPAMRAARQIFEVHLPAGVPVHPNGTSAAASRRELIETAVTRLYSPNAGNEVARLRFRDGHARVVFARDLMSGRVCRQICLGARESASARDAAARAVGIGEGGVRLEDIEHAVSNALDRMGTMLTPRNVRSYLEIADDADVLAVDRIRRQTNPERYRVAPAGA